MEYNKASSPTKYIRTALKFDDILENDEWMAHFLNFLIEIEVSELLMFWQEVELYQRKLVGRPDKLRRHAIRIVKSYLLLPSSQEELFEKERERNSTNMSKREKRNNLWHSDTDFGFTWIFTK